ncbi:MAG: hypothetical protein M0T85_01780 [Dehalococcoidales bacterium]|nr:hypothetical protein [Dehalococcoidales bacterium]
MIDKGLTLPNYQWKRWSQSELDAVVDLAPDVLVVMVYDYDIPASSDKFVQLEMLLKRLPSLKRLQLRPYNTNIPQLSPEEWAAECDRRIAPYRTLGIPLELIPSNEWNLAAEGGHTDWAKHLDWFLRFGRAFRALDRATKLHISAPSPGLKGYAYVWVIFGHNKELMALYDVADAHCYPGSERCYEDLHAAIRTLPISITEFNAMDPAAYLASLPSYVRDVSWFILRGEDDQRPYWLMGSPYYKSFRDYKSGGETMVWDRHEVFDLVQKKLGGEGFNPDNAFGQFIERYPELQVGIYVGGILGYDRDDWPYLVQPTSTGALYVPKANATADSVKFIIREEQLPLA